VYYLIESLILLFNSRYRVGQLSNWGFIQTDVRPTIHHKVTAQVHKKNEPAGTGSAFRLLLVHCRSTTTCLD